MYLEDSYVLGIDSGDRECPVHALAAPDDAAFEDATGEVDYGAIDSWTLDGDVSHIEGDGSALGVGRATRRA